MAEAAIRERLWKTVMSLPPTLLRAVSGGRAVHVAGRTLDPRFQLLLHLARRGAAGEPSSENPGDLPFPVAGAEPGVRATAVPIDGPRGTIEARMLVPSGVAENAPLLVYAHRAGGGAPGLIARAGGIRVLAVPYRLGAEQRFPAGLNDLLAAYVWARETAARAGSAPNLAVGGESLGAGMAAAACLELKRLGQHQPALQLLLYPALDATEEPAAGEAFADAVLLSPGLEAWRSGRMIGPADDPLDPRLSPLKAGRHDHLAPAVIAGAGYDPLAGQARDYAKALRSAGGAVTYRPFDALPHGFLDYAGVVDSARAAAEAVAGLAGAALRGETTRPPERPGG